MRLDFSQVPFPGKVKGQVPVRLDFSQVPFCAKVKGQVPVRLDFSQVPFPAKVKGQVPVRLDFFSCQGQRSGARTSARFLSRPRSKVGRQ